MRHFFFEPQLPVNLGLVRIFIFQIIFVNAVTSAAAWYTKLPATFIQIPVGWDWAAEFLPLSPGVVHRAQQILVLCSGLACVGLFTRPAAIVAALLSVPIFGIPNFYFKISHGMHVPVLSALVIAASPAGDGASIDALIRRFRGQPLPAASTAYTVPVRFCWLLAGTMYLFPGLWKLWQCGDYWLDGTKLHSELFKKWQQLPEHVAPIRIDHWPGVLMVLGVATLIFEIGYFLALFKRTSRIIAGFAAALFHIGTGLSMQIWFDPLHPLIVLIDYPKILKIRPLPPLARVGGLVAAWFASKLPRSPGREATRHSTLPAWVVGSVLLFGMFYTGLHGIDSWPVAVYPRFSEHNRKLPKEGSALRFIAVDQHGVERELSHEFRPLEDTAAVFRIARATLQLKKAKKRAQFREHVALLAEIARMNGGRPGERLRIVELKFAVDPSLRQGPPRLSVLTETEM